MTSASLPVRPKWSAVSWASASFTGVRSERSEFSTPWRSRTARSRTPASSRIRATATPAAPAPEITTRVVAGSRPVRVSAFLRAASATTAVPCWSSWKTGIDNRSFSRSSISKQRGAEMSSRLIPPKLGREPRDRLDDLLDVGGVQADGYAVDAAELLEQHGLALHHRHRRSRTDVAEPQHRRTVGDDRHRVGDPGVVPGEGRVGGDRLADPGHARRVGQRQLVAPGQRHRGPDLHLAADVQVEDRVTGVRMGVVIAVGGSHHHLLALRAARALRGQWGTSESVTAAAGAGARPAAGRRRPRRARPPAPGGASRRRRPGCR